MLKTTKDAVWSGSTEPWLYRVIGRWYGKDSRPAPSLLSISPPETGRDGQNTRVGVCGTLSVHTQREGEEQELTHPGQGREA
jgi:hypothetical protein